MDKKLLKQLVDYSYVGEKLNVERVGKVTKLLKNKREDFKMYIRGIKKRERYLHVFIDLAKNNFEQFKNAFKKIFPNKKIAWNIDPSLLLGVRITEGDNVLEMSLKRSLLQIVSKIEQSYD